MILLSKWSKLRLNWMATVMVYGLKTLGLAPLSHQIITLRLNSGKTCTVRGFCFSKIGTAYNILLLILHLVITGLILFEEDKLLQKNWVMSTVLMGSCYITTSVIIISWSFRQAEAVSVMNRLLEVDLLLSGTENYRLSNNRMVRSFSLHSMFNVLLWITHIVWVASTRRFDWLFASRLWMKVLTYLIYWFIIEYSVVLGLIINEVGRVNENLLKLKELPIDISGKPFITNRLAVVNLPSRCSLLATIKLLRTIRTTIYEVSKNVADFYSLPILVSIGCFCFIFIDNVSYSVATMKIGGKFSLSNICLNALAIVKVAYSMTLLALNVTKIAKEVKLTGFIVHKLLATATKPEVRSELEQFSLQVLHERFSFTAYGLFSLDCEMLHSILQVVVGYVIIWEPNSENQQN